MPGMTGTSYTGPVSLWGSKYAAPARAQASLPYPTSKASNALVTIATKQQIASTDGSSNPDAELASTQNVALKEEVDKHNAHFKESVSTAVTNTRHLLDLLRQAVKQDTSSSHSDLQKSVDSLWDELENLFNTAKGAHDALPEFLGKQEENMRLYHRAAVNDAMREFQDEVNLQHKKVNIQHDIILDHQSAFQDYKSRTESKLKTLQELEERVSRLTLDKGLLKSELDNYSKMLEDAKLAEADSAKTTAQLQTELQTAVVSKHELGSENQSLRSAISQLQGDLKDAEQRTASLRKEIADFTSVRDESARLQADHEKAINGMRASQAVLKKEINQLKAENKILQDKFRNQSAEYSNIFTKSNEQAKTLAKLQEKLEAEQKKNGELNSNLQMLALEKEKASRLELTQEDLEAQIEALKLQIENAGKDADRARKDSEAKVKQLEEDNDEVEIEHNDFLAQVVEHKKTLSELKVIQEENSKLRSLAQELKRDGTLTSNTVDDSQVKALQDKVKESEAKLAGMADLQSTLDQWKLLAERSYQQYKEILPTYKEASVIREVAVKKDAEIMQLKEQLAAKGNSTADPSTGYWKGKYDALLATLN